MPQVKVIQPLSEPSKKLRVAAYARVSSDSADQLNSFATQVDYYTGYIQSKDEWEFAGLYADEAISGITADKRSDFQRLLVDCHAGKIDRILVKSISRFARNTLDCIQTVRELKQLNIPVEFEKENIDTGSMGSEMLLSVLGAAAQEKSLSISKNLKWNYRHRMKNGDFTTHIAPFGYSYKSKTLVPNPNEVPIIEFIFNSYLSGKSLSEIAKELTQNEKPITSEKHSEWNRTSIQYTAASIDETVPDEPPISPEDNSGTVEASPPPSPEPSAEPDADENPDGTEDSTASEPDAAPTPDVSATQMPTPIPTPNPINLEYEYLPESETGGLFVFPAPYGDDLTQEYSAEHPAWDIAGDIGSPVVAANDGVVTQVQIWDGSEDETGSMSYGNMVQIKHGEELTTLYAHLSEINVQEGDTVVRGQRIGRIGDTGNATGAHLHFEFITSSGRKVSPDWLLASDIMPLLSPDLPYATVKEWCNRPNGTRTISDFGVTREEVIAELSAHVSDSYYLGTPYQGRDWQSPNGDPSYNGRAGLNCGGFVAYVLSKCGLNSGTSDLWTHSAGPVGSVQWYMTQNADITGGAWWDWDGVSPVYNRMLMCGAANYPLWVRNADLVAHTFATKADMLSSGVLEKGDIIVMIPKAASSSGFNDSHIGFFWGNSSSEDKMWHSDFSGNHISTITPKSPDNSFIVIKYGENTFDITLTKTSANVTITNKNPNYSLAGAVYNVYTKNATPGHDYSKDTVQATFTTDTNGKANLSKKLKDGDYAVKEITAPKGYVLDPTIHFVNISSGNTTLNVVDDPSKIKLTVVKKDAGTGQSVPQGNASLAGAVYEVTYKVNGIDTKVQGTTNAQGRVMFLDIPLGTVKVQEIKAPVGYKLDTMVHTYTVNSAGTSAVYELEPLDDFREQVFLNKIKVIKKAEMAGAPDMLEPGAKFEVYLKSAGSYANAKAAERDLITIGSDGTATTKFLPYGTYTVHQVAGGAGRKFAADFDVSVSADSSTHAPYEVNLRNELKPGTANIVKTSDDGVVAGLKFKITRNIDNWSQNVTTGANGQIAVSNLPIYSDIDGKQKIQYTITEIDTPDRYVQPASQTVTLTEGQATPVRFHNKLIRGSLQIIKVDHNGTTPLEGAEYQITDADGRAVAAKTTGKDGKILVENLRYGSYHYQEIEAPKGYDLDSTIYDFAIGYDEQVITVTRENTPSVGSISVCKVNSAGTPMSGVSFLLEFSVDDGASWKPVVARPAGSEVSIGGCDSSGLKDGVLVTGDDGIAAFTGLQIDNQTVKIRYRLTEIATRDGSTLMTTVLYDGSLPDVNGDTEITDVKITAVNNRNLELPNSGGSGFPVSSVGTVLIFIGLFFCVGSIRVLRKAR